MEEQYNLENPVKVTKKTTLVIQDDNNDEEVIIKNKNKGTGAGGANTNKNGLSYEGMTNLESLYSECNKNKKDKTSIIKFNGYENELVNANKSTLHKYMKNLEILWLSYNRIDKLTDKFINFCQ